MPPVVLLITDGFQVPVMPFGEVLFKIGTDDPLQMASVVAKFGTTLFETVTASVTGDAHWPAFGVKM